MRVLVVDDSQSSRAVLTRMLTAWGYDVIECGDGLEAWEILSRDDAPTLAIVDWIMPRIDGVELCRRVRARASDAYTFMYLLTGRASPDDVFSGLEAGADDYLTKPVSPAELRVRLRNGARVVELHRELVMARDALRIQALLDPLTQIPNRRALADIASKELARAQREARPLALLVIDLDHFKRVNDTLGHAAGDEVLVEAVARMKRALRESDHLARFGGEELVALLPGCEPRHAVLVAERLRRRLSADPVQTDAGPVRVTASVGVAVALDGTEPQASLFVRADRALYRAKEEGRDRVVLATRTHPDEPAPPVRAA